jgi:HD-GYP domain-containing protein (c-di-GMP phosphodiesterase class II)
MLTTNREKPRSRQLSAADQAKALAVILREEFGVPFICYDAGSGAMLWFQEVEGLSEPAVQLEPDAVRRLALEGRPSVTALPSGYYQLVLPLYASGQPMLVAAAVVASVCHGPDGRAASPSGAHEAEERVRLQKWLQAVGDRLRSSDLLLTQRRSEDEQSAQVKAAWEVILTLDHLLRHVRIHKNPARTQKRILQAAFDLLGVQSLIWVPQDLEAAVLIQGEPCLSPPDCRQLAACLLKSADADSTGPVICNQVREKGWATRFPHLANLMAFTVNDQGHQGWIIAVNKKGNRKESGEAIPQSAVHASAAPPPTSDFRRSDAALLTPFVALFEQYARNSSRYQDLKNLLVGLTRSLTSALDAKDTYTYGHSERVARIAVELGRELGLGGDELGDLYLAGLLHDIGKIGISDVVLDKPDGLTPEEAAHIRQHVTIGYSILSDLRQIRNVLPGVLYHHERYDGTGYPDGLAGEAIPLVARILAVADSFDAMSTTRPYRQAIPCQQVEETLMGGAGKQWDPRIIEAFMRCRLKIHAIRQRGVGESLRHAVDGVLRQDGSSILSLTEAPAPV